MNEDTVTGNWKQLSCMIKKKQAQRTAGARNKTDNKQDYRLGKLQAHYYRLAEQDFKGPGHA